MRILNEEVILHYLKCIHKCLYKREAEGHLTSAVRDMMVEAGDWSDARKGSGAKKWRKSPETKKWKELDFPLNPTEQTSLSHTLTSLQ